MTDQFDAEVPAPEAPQPTAVGGPEVQPQFQVLRLARLERSPTNPRRTFDEAEHLELTDSVRQHGVLQPILARPHPEKPEYWEIVAGERRYRAALAAELREIPAMVRVLTDDEVLELQLVENLKRADLHPLEEAEGYHRLLSRGRMNADEMAVKIGKSRAYVYGRLKLLDLSETGRKALYADKLSASTALLIARIPTEDLQRKAIKDITETWQGPITYRAAADHIQRNYMLRLEGAPFPRHDAGLVPDAGSCRECPKRTGSQPDLFPDVKSGDVCTDPVCFRGKSDAHKARLREQAEARGQKVLSGKEAKAALSGDYVRLEDKDWQLTMSGKTYKQMLGKSAPEPVLIEDHDGQLVEALPKKEVAQALRDKGHKVAGRGGDDEVAKAAKAAVKKLAIERTYRERLCTALLARVAERKHYDLGLAARAMWEEMQHDAQLQLLKARGWGMHEFDTRVDALDPEARYYLLVEMSLTPDVIVGKHNLSGTPKRMVALAEALELDPSTVRREVTAESKSQERAKAKKTKKPAAEKAPKASAPKPAARRAKKSAPPAEPATEAHAIAVGNRVRVTGDLPGRSIPMKQRLKGVTGTVIESYVDGRVRIQWGSVPQNRAWLKPADFERVAASDASITTSDLTPTEPTLRYPHDDMGTPMEASR